MLKYKKAPMRQTYTPKDALIMKKILLKIFGITFLSAGIIFGYIAISTYYKEKLSTKDWATATATVTMAGYREDDPNSTVMDVEYMFPVPPLETYYGYINGTTKYYETNDTFEIKYNPDNPYISTTKLAPNKDMLIFGLICSVMCIIIGVCATFGVPELKYNLLRRIKERNYGKKRRPYSSKPPIDRGFPIKLTFMAAAAGIREAWMFYVTDIFFIAVCAYAKVSAYYYIFFAAILIFLFDISVRRIVGNVWKYYADLGKLRFYRIVDEALEEPRSSVSDFITIMSALDRYFE